MPLIFDKPATLLEYKENTTANFYWSSSLFKRREKEITKSTSSQKKEQLFNNKNYSENTKISVLNEALNSGRIKIISEVLQQLSLDLSESDIIPAEAYVLTNSHPILKTGVFHYCSGLSKFTQINSNAYVSDQQSSNFLLILTSLYTSDSLLSNIRQPRKVFFDMGMIAGHLKALCLKRNLKIFENLSFYDFELFDILQINPCFELPIVLFSFGDER